MLARIGAKSDDFSIGRGGSTQVPRMKTFHTLALAALASGCLGRTSYDEPSLRGDALAANPLPPSEREPIASTSADDVWLAFEAQGGGAASIFVGRADGSHIHRLATGTPSAAAPAFSANGRALAFDGGDHLYVMDLATGKSQPVTAGSGGNPAWSPDGKLLAFTRGVDIWLVGADGKGERPLVQGPPPGQAWYSNYGHPAFTRDGSSVLFDRRGAIERIGLDGSNQHVIWAHGDDIAPPALSPDGTMLIFSGECDYPDPGWSGAIRIVPLANAADACHTSKILDAYTMDMRPAWGANGLVAYIDRPGGIDVHIVPAAGGTPRLLMGDAEAKITGGQYLGEVAWSPPGTQLP